MGFEILVTFSDYTYSYFLNNLDALPYNFKLNFKLELELLFSSVNFLG